MKFRTFDAGFEAVEAAIAELENSPYRSSALDRIHEIDGLIAELTAGVLYGLATRKEIQEHIKRFEWSMLAREYRQINKFRKNVRYLERLSKNFGAIRSSFEIGSPIHVLIAIRERLKSMPGNYFDSRLLTAPDSLDRQMKRALNDSAIPQLGWYTVAEFEKVLDSELGRIDATLSEKLLNKRKALSNLQDRVIPAIIGRIRKSAIFGFERLVDARSGGELSRRRERLVKLRRRASVLRDRFDLKI